MGLPAVGNTNIGLYAVGSSVAEATDCTDTSNISLKQLSIGGHNFGSEGGDASNFDLLGGSNNSISGFSSGGTDITSAATLAIGGAPYAMSELVGGQHEDGGGPGR